MEYRIRHGFKFYVQIKISKNINNQMNDFMYTLPKFQFKIYMKA